MQRVFKLFVFTIFAATLAPACGDDNSDDGSALDCAAIECPADGVLFVDADATGDETGLSWADAASGLQLGLAMGACCAPAQLWVAEGTYTPGTEQEDTFQLIAGVALYGGFAGTEAALDERDWTAHETILHGADGGTFHVVTGASGAALDGFTITGGGVALGFDEVDDEYFEAPERYQGAGMRNVGCDETLVVANCLFTMNILTAGLGAGMYNEDSAPTVTDCSFIDNDLGISTDYGAPSGSGGGIANVASSPVIEDSLFQGNRCASGAGIANSDSSPRITGCVFEENVANSGAGLSQNGGEVILADCAFQGNRTTAVDIDNGPGGGVLSISGSLDVSGCSFLDNRAGQGGALHVRDSILRVGGSVFAGNQLDLNDPSWARGGAVCLDGAIDAAITNSAFESNTATIEDPGDPMSIVGGAISAVSTGESLPALSITSCSFFGNLATGSGGSIYATAATIINSIFFGDSPDELSGPDGFVHDVTYSLVSGGHDGEGNIDGDPLFVDAEAGDLHLQAGSPCIDTGSTAALPPDTADLDGDGDVTEPIPFDLDGNPRVTGAAVDMGAYESVGE